METCPMIVTNDDDGGRGIVRFPHPISEREHKDGHDERKNEDKGSNHRVVHSVSTICVCPAWNSSATSCIHDPLRVHLDPQEQRTTDSSLLVVLTAS